MRDKRTGVDDAIARIEDGMTIGIGGWGTRRKPMALVRALLRSPVRDLRVVTYGGPEVGLLCAAGKVRELVCGFVSLEIVPHDPWFRRLRQSGAQPTVELDEGMLCTGLRAAAARLPFLPTRAGLGSDVLTHAPWITTVRSPYDDREEVVAMPALALDVALVHLHRADAHGNARHLDDDPFFDDLFCAAAALRIVSCERVLDTAALMAAGPPQGLLLDRLAVDAVVEAPGGARFTACEPDYGRDEGLLRDYVAAADDAADQAGFTESYARRTLADATACRDAAPTLVRR